MWQRWKQGKVLDIYSLMKIWRSTSSSEDWGLLAPNGVAVSGTENWGTLFSANRHICCRALPGTTASPGPYFLYVKKGFSLLTFLSSKVETQVGGTNQGRIRNSFSSSRNKSSQETVTPAIKAQFPQGYTQQSDMYFELLCRTELYQRQRTVTLCADHKLQILLAGTRELMIRIFKHHPWPPASTNENSHSPAALSSVLP